MCGWCDVQIDKTVMGYRICGFSVCVYMDPNWDDLAFCENQIVRVASRIHLYMAAKIDEIIYSFSQLGD